MRVFELKIECFFCTVVNKSIRLNLRAMNRMTNFDDNFKGTTHFFVRFVTLKNASKRWDPETEVFMGFQLIPTVRSSKLESLFFIIFLSVFQQHNSRSILSRENISPIYFLLFNTLTILLFHTVGACKTKIVNVILVTVFRARTVKFDSCTDFGFNTKRTEFVFGR